MGRPVVDREPRFSPDYLAAVDAETLERLDPLRGKVRLLGAGRLGRARLLDNIGVTVPEP